MAAANLTAARLRELLHYDQNSGLFTWTVERRGASSGDSAGYPDRDGYLRFTVCRRAYAAHRLAWLYVTGEWPKGQVDHINGNPSDNRWSNLRDVSPSTNAQNIRCAHKDSQSGILGVYLVALTGKWVVKLTANGKKHHLGTFDTPEVAKDVYLAAKRLLHQGCTI